MSAAERLYTPELLGLAVELTQWPPFDTTSHRGEARSPTCGSTLAMDLAVDDEGGIERLGMRVRACAVGQAAAAIFARHAVGTNEAELTAALSSVEAWLDGHGPVPDWPGLGTIAAAREYPGRHGAILLPWKAALAALSSTGRAG
jgi:NifU-like protein involved in Fe-S cluster formation